MAESIGLEAIVSCAQPRGTATPAKAHESDEESRSWPTSRLPRRVRLDETFGRASERCPESLRLVSQPLRYCGPFSNDRGMNSVRRVESTKFRVGCQCTSCCGMTAKYDAFALRKGQSLTA
eukprot:6460033-Amphidinium_carterae.1